MPLSRTYDTILSVDNAFGFYNGIVVIGNTTGTVGIVANVNFDTNQLKVKIANTLQEFINGEAIHANVQPLTGPIVNIVYFSNTATTNVRGNSYTIDGNTTVFPLPEDYLPDFRDIIHISADGLTVPSTAYVWPASNLNEYGVEFLSRSVFGQIPDDYEVNTQDGHRIPRSQIQPTGRESKR